tara:strand:+ start:236 stop:877 length:642 start_codon:yes stop_codon:yes gene_type:complete
MTKKKENNLELWEAVSVTDPKHTKKVNQRGGFTAIAAQSQVKRATEVFGIMGHGWGVEDEKFTTVEGTSMVIYNAKLWYTFNDKTGSIPIHSSIKYGSNGRYDDDFAKKVATDALTKGLSKLGFNADVFMGLFDDNKYVADVTEKFKKVGDNRWVIEITKASKKLSDADRKRIEESVYNGKVNQNNYKSALKRIGELALQYEEQMIEAKKNNG